MDALSKEPRMLFMIVERFRLLRPRKIAPVFWRCLDGRAPMEALSIDRKYMSLIGS